VIKKKMGKGATENFGWFPPHEWIGDPQ